jgi:hypothetical protein
MLLSDITIHRMDKFMEDQVHIEPTTESGISCRRPVRDSMFP